MRRIASILIPLALVLSCEKGTGRPSDAGKGEEKVPGTVQTYVYSRSLKVSQLYDVTVNTETQMVLRTEEPHICAFGCSDTVKVTVDLLSGKAESVAVRPLNKGYRYRQEDDGRLTLFLAPLDRVVVEFNGSSENPLFLFANPLEEKPAREECAYYFEAGKTYEKTITLSSGKVYLEAGSYVSGQIHVLSGSNVQIAGYGILNGVGGSKPVFINNSDNVSVDGIILVNHDFWSTLATQSTNISFNNYKVVAPASSNEQGHENDALDILGCSHVRINDCFTYCHDDALCIKSEKWLYKGKVEDYLAEDCIIWNYNNGTSLEIGLELNQDCSDVHFKDIYCVHSGGGMNSGLQRAGIGMKQCAGGTLSNFSFENIYIEDAKEFGIYLGIYKSYASIGEGVEWQPGAIDGVSFKNIHIDGPAPYGNVIKGYDNDQHSIKNVHFEGLYRNGERITDAKSFFNTCVNSSVTIE